MQNLENKKTFEDIVKANAENVKESISKKTYDEAHKQITEGLTDSEIKTLAIKTFIHLLSEELASYTNKQ